MAPLKNGVARFIRDMLDAPGSRTGMSGRPLMLDSSEDKYIFGPLAGSIEWTALRSFLAGELTFRSGRMFIAVAPSVGQDPLLDTTESYWSDPNPMGVLRQGLINGTPRLWQRGTSFTDASLNAFYTADRWAYERISAATARVTVSKETSVIPTGHGNAIKVACTTAQVSPAVTDYAVLRYRMEGYDFYPYVGRTALLSFWVYSSKVGTFGVAFRNSGKDRSYYSTVTIASAGVWQFVQVPIRFNYSGGTWDYTNGIGIEIDIVLMAGTNFQGTAGAWASDAKMTTTAQTNFLDNTSNLFYISGAMIHNGGTIMPFANISLDEEIRRAQRYYEKSYDLAVTPGTIEANPRGAFRTQIIPGGAGNHIWPSVQYKTRKRAYSGGVAGIYSTNSGNPTVVYGPDGPADYNATDFYPGETGYGIQIDGPGIQGYRVWWHWTVDAEL